MKILVHKPNYLGDDYKKSNPVVITALYKFCDIPNLNQFADELRLLMQNNGILGTVLLGSEGINGTVSALSCDMQIFYEFLNNYECFAGMELKESYYHTHPFGKIKVKIKPEIVTIGMECAFDPGMYIEPEDWAGFISRSDVITIDTRNDYEFHIGTFKGSLNPKTNNFREFVSWFDERKTEFEGKKIAMFCTGGIRCEKSTSFLKKEGFDEVYHLKGGILNYFLKTQNISKAWLGDCFVFDDRIIVSDKLEAY
jgi:UPF0176 protein